MSETKNRVGITVNLSRDASIRPRPVELRERTDLVRIWIAIHLGADWISSRSQSSFMSSRSYRDSICIAGSQPTLRTAQRELWQAQLKGPPGEHYGSVPGELVWGLHLWSCRALRGCSPTHTSVRPSAPGAESACVSQNSQLPAGLSKAPDESSLFYHRPPRHLVPSHQPFITEGKSRFSISFDLLISCLSTRHLAITSCSTRSAALESSGSLRSATSLQDARTVCS